MRLPFVLLAGALLAPSVASHGALEASELEIELLADETTDAVYATGGFDVAQVFLGEAHVPDLGEAAAGDGVYFRGTFAGRPGAEGDSRIVFSFDSPGGRIERTVTIGTAVASDFDLLVAELTDDGLAIERAFLTYASAGIAPGEVLGGFRVATYSGPRQVDVAPGGLHAGPLEAPAGESRVVNAEAPLGGAGRYLDVAARLDGDTIVLTATSLLQKGSQHVDLRLLASAATTEGPTSVSVGPAGVAEFRVKPLATTRLDVTTDVGGRDGLLVDLAEGVQVVREEDGVVLAGAGAPTNGRDVPAPWGLALLALLAVAARRR